MFRRELDRVANEVPNGLLETHRVSQDMRFVGVQPQVERQKFLFNAGITDLPGSGEQRVKLHRGLVKLQFPVGDPREIEQIIDQARFQLDIPTYHRDVLPH